jgi:Flp pilus assembly protein TadD
LIEINVATKHHLEGLSQLCRDRPQEAVKLFESAASTEPDNPAHWHALGQVYQETESPVAALRAFDAALSLNPNDVVALSQSYQPLLTVGKFQKARQRLEQALKLSPNDCRTLQLLVTHRCHQGLVAGEQGRPLVTS